MIMWIMAGLVATFGALCYAEVGLLIPKSGGEYPIIYDSYGDIPGFLFAWVSDRFHSTEIQALLLKIIDYLLVQTCTTIIRPASLAIFCVTFAQYAYSIVGTCDRQDGSEKLLAICAIWSGYLVFKQTYADRIHYDLR